MVAGFDQSVHLLREAYQAFIIFVATFVDVVQLSDEALVLQFFQKNFPLVWAHIFNGVLGPFISGETQDSQDDVAPVDLPQCVDWVLLFELALFPRPQHFLKEQFTLNVVCYLIFRMLVDFLDTNVNIKFVAIVAIVLKLDL